MTSPVEIESCAVDANTTIVIFYIPLDHQFLIRATTPSKTVEKTLQAQIEPRFGIDEADRETLTRVGNELLGML